MRMQLSSKDEKNCVRCDNVILRSEKRRTDGGMHSHFTCPPKRDECEEFFNELINRVRG